MEPSSEEKIRPTPQRESALLASKARKVQHNVKRKAIYVNEKTSQRRELCSQFKCH